MGQQKGVGAFKVTRCNAGFAFKHVKPGGGDPAGFKRRNQRLIIDHRTAGSVDDNRSVREKTDPFFVEQMSRFSRQRAMQRQKIADRKQAFQRFVKNCTLFGFGIQAAAIVIVNFHAKGACARSDSLADVTHADNTQSFARYLDPHQLGRRPTGPAITDHLRSFPHPPGCPQHQQQSDIGRSVGQHTRRVGDDDAAFLCRRQVDVFKANGKGRNSAHTFGQSQDDVCAKIVCNGAEETIHPTAAGQHIFDAIGIVCGVGHRFVGRVCAVGHGTREPSGYQDFFLFQHGYWPLIQTQEQVRRYTLQRVIAEQARGRQEPIFYFSLLHKEPTKVTLDPTLLSAVLAITSAFLFALSIQIQNLGLKHAEPRPAVLVNISSTVVAYWILSPFFVHASYWLTSATAIFIVVGLFRPALSVNLAMAGVKHLGPTLASGIAATNPLFAACFAVLLLGEDLTWPMAIGTLAVVVGVAISTLRPGGITRGWPLWAIGLPLGAAFSRSLGHPLTMIGLAELPSPFFAGMVSYTVSIIVVYAVFRLEGRRMPTLTRGYLWFVLSGLLNGISIYSLNTALNIGNLLTVAPIVACSPVFTILLGLFVFKKETITWQTTVTIAMVVSGVILIIINP